MELKSQKFGWLEQGRGSSECLDASRRAVGLSPAPTKPEDLGYIEDFVAVYLRHRRLGFSRGASLSMAWEVWK
jgi:hypothetical protein